MLYAFTGRNKADGAFPEAGLTFDASGSTLYGTTFQGGSSRNYGTVFKLTPPPAGKTQWTKTELNNFQGGSDGANPTAGVIRDASGALYGTTSGYYLGRGTVFKLTPPAPGKPWTHQVLYRFKGSKYNDGESPHAGLVRDASSGALYGTTRSGGSSGNYGTVFKLTPPAAGKTQWTETVLCRFDGTHGAYPYTGLILDKGALYGTTSQGGQYNKGTVFKLAPRASVVLLLYSFDGTHGADPSGLVFDSNKIALYGTTYSGGANGTGTVFKLTPPAAGTLWKETVLYSFLGVVSRTDGRNPWGGLTFDASGALYGTTAFGGTNGKGTVFKLKP